MFPDRKPLVLIVDDVAKNLQVLGSHLKKEEVEIAVATNGVQAIHVANKALPDLILLDVMMPEMDGFETCKQLKASPFTADIPVIFLTARTETEDVVNGLKLGAVDYVTKPFNGAEVLTRVKTHLALKFAREELQLANRTKDKFFSIIGHDLRSPFSTLIGFSEYLMDDYAKMDDAAKQDIIGDILSISKRSYQLFENLLAWSKSQSGSMPCNFEKVDLCQLLDEHLVILQKKAKEKEIDLVCDVPENMLVNADVQMILTVIRNLISNAIKFTPRNGEIKVSAVPAGDGFIQTTISDSGVGIPDEVKKRLFLVGEHVSTMGTEQEQGSGLGLMLCAEFVKKHQGEIWIDSEPGKGSRFHFTMPVAE